MATMASKTTDNLFEICALCSESITIYAIGKCDHPVCYKCSTRMRVLCEQRYCAICRTNMPKVIFCKKLHKFDSIRTHGYPCYRRQMIYFETDSIQSEFYKLQEHSCSLHSEQKIFNSFKLLKNHMKKEHGRFYCDLCVEHLKVFTFERKAYTRPKLAEHRRIGDTDDRSQSHKGHPLCEFCEERYLDNDELVRHLRKQHYVCHFCESDGISNQFYDIYEDLRKHFQDHHYLCEEGECAEVEFTNAFRSEIDLKAHISQTHGRDMSRAAVRQARTIDINIQYSDSRSGRRLDHRGHRDGQQREKRPGLSRGRARRDQEKEREEEENARTISAVLNTDIARQGSVNVVDKALLQGSLPGTNPRPEELKAATFEERTADFPTLDGRLADRSSDEEEKSGEGSSGREQDTLAKKVARANKFSVQDGGMEDEDFPTLSGKPVTAHWPPPNSGWDFSAAAEDFPSLGPSTGKETSHPARWLSTRPQRSLPTFSHAPVNALKDFPSLSSIGGSLVKPKAQCPSALTQSKATPCTAQTTVSKSSSPQAKKRDWIQGCDVSDRTTEILLKNSVQGPEAKIRTVTKGPDPSPPVPLSSNKPLTMADFPSLHGSSAATKKPVLAPAPNTAWGTKKEEPEKEPEPEEKPTDHHFLKMKTKDKKKKRKGAIGASQDIGWDCASTAGGNDADAGSRDSCTDARIQSEAEGMEVPVDIARITETAAKTLQHSKDDSAGKERKNKKKSKQKKKEATKTAQKEKVEEKVEKFMANEDLDRALEAKKEMSLLVCAKSKSKESKESLTQNVKKDTCDSDDPVWKERTSDSCPALPAPSMHIHSSDTTIDRSLPVEEAHPQRPFQDNSNTLGSSAPRGVSVPKPDDYPPLNAVPSKLPQPPPGFTAAGTRPPPGFANHWTANAEKGPPPGFAQTPSPVSDNTELESAPRLSNRENIAPASNGTAASYIQPSDFQQRNRQLISDINALLDNSSDKFVQFKESSGSFRQGKIDAAKYHSKCSEVLGKVEFAKIFPELLVLLPDIEKQQQLLAAHREAEKASANTMVKTSKSRTAAWSAGNMDKFVICCVCHQVVAACDISAHQREHTSSEDFPSLGSSAAPGIVGMGYRCRRK